jgi:hypothetical protein
MRGPSNATLAAEWGVPVGEDWSAARQAGYYLID